MIRLDKYIADAAGLTRSEAGKAIRSGAVAVDGTVLRKPERKIDEAAAAVSLNGMPCVWRRFRYYLLDKPAGLITASRDRRRRRFWTCFRRRSSGWTSPRSEDWTRIQAACCS